MYPIIPKFSESCQFKNFHRFDILLRPLPNRVSYFIFMYRNFVKPSLDFLFSLVLLLALSPVIILIGTILFFQNKRKPFFFQKRIGNRNREFTIIKFKTMQDTRDDKGNLLPDKERITAFGYWLRNHSLDELPQLLNVLFGEMSFIGPRPLLPEYLPLYNSRQILRHSVRPGITGWAQVNGRNAISWSEKFELDVFYVENLGFKLDWKIILLTISKVFKKEGVNSSAEITMEKFKGN